MLHQRSSRDQEIITMMISEDFPGTDTLFVSKGEIKDG
jgi:hypothetical protein